MQQMLLVPFVLFLILVTWALISGDMYAKEALIWGAIWLVCLVGFFLVPGYGLYFVAPACLVDIILLIKLVGNPSAT
jgi:hypothetical protein